MGDEERDRRGWSVVFDDKTGEDADDTSETILPERTVAQPVDLEALGAGETTDAHPSPFGPGAAPELGPESGSYDAADPPTIIDEALSEEVKAAMAAAVSGDTDPALDERLANVALALEATDDDALSAAGEQIEQTVKTAAPFEVRVSPVVETEPVSEVVEKTQRARVPFDLKAEQTLPPSARDKRPGARAAVIVERVGPGVVPTEPEPPKPAKDGEAAERTALDLAAALGMAPEPSTRAKVPEPVFSPLPEPQLRVPEKGAEPKLDFGLDPAPPKKRPREGLRSDQLASVTESTQRIAKLIPLALGLFLVLATIAVSLSLFRREQRQEHVELRFMAVGSDAPVAKPSSAGTPIVIETEPPGLLVLFDRKILGKTPYSGTVPVALDDTVAIELSSPYFERWLGEVAVGPAGDYTVEVELTRKARR